jgi:hypothetical protein
MLPDDAHNSQTFYSNDKTCETSNSLDSKKMKNATTMTLETNIVFQQFRNLQ